MKWWREWREWVENKRSERERLLEKFVEEDIQEGMIEFRARHVIDRVRSHDKRYS